MPLKAEVNKNKSMGDIYGYFSNSFSHSITRIGQNTMVELLDRLAGIDYICIVLI